MKYEVKHAMKHGDLCPYCQQVLHVEDDVFECGGDGEGICSIWCAIYDFGQAVEKLPTSATLDEALWIDEWLAGFAGQSWSEAGWDRDLHLRGVRDLEPLMTKTKAATKTKTKAAPAKITARLGAWTPWAQVLCVECDYAGLKNSPSAQTFASRLQKLSAMPRADEVAQPDSESLIGTCNGCDCACWVRDDVALLQRLSLKASKLGAPASCMEQTGGMCAALAFDTDVCRIRVSAMDGGFAVCEYAMVDGEWWDHLRQSWDSEALYESGAWKPDHELEIAIEECARKVIEFIRASDMSDPGAARRHQE